MARTVNIETADERLRDLALNAGESAEPCFLRVGGRPVAVVLSIEAYESLLETLDIEADEELVASISRGMEDVAEGRTRPASEAIACIKARRRSAG